MNNTNYHYLINLIRRFNDHSTVQSTEKGLLTTVSSTAVTEVNSLRDSSYIPLLKQILEHSSHNKIFISGISNEDVRSTVYVMLSRISNRNKSLDVQNLLIEKIGSEVNKDILSVLFDAISNGVRINVSKVIPYIYHASPRTRHAAMRSLGVADKTSRSEAETALLDRAQKKADQFDFMNICEGLEGCGSPTSKSFLDSLLKHKVGRVRARALIALLLYLGKQEVVKYANIGLQDRNIEVRSVAQAWLENNKNLFHSKL